MNYPFVPDPGFIADHFIAALLAAQKVEVPFTHFKLKNVLPLDVCTAILTLPIAPPLLGVTDGTRGSYNNKRTFFTPELRKDFIVCENLSQALQSTAVANQLKKTCAIDIRNAYLRVEYMQDIDGMWLEPHCDIKEKLFSMVIYLFIGPEAKDWGTDLYDNEKKWHSRSNAKFNSAAIFKSGHNTWHGFEKRPIKGVRRLLEINYVRKWRDTDQLCFPTHMIKGV